MVASWVISVELIIDRKREVSDRPILAGALDQVGDFQKTVDLPTVELPEQKVVEDKSCLESATIGDQCKSDRRDDCDPCNVAAIRHSPNHAPRRGQTQDS